MSPRPLRSVAVLLACVLLATACFASVYTAQPKLIVIIVIDQYRADLLERGRAQFGEGGFRLFTDRGAWFTNCNYDYANTETAPGHSTLLTGAYSDGHGIADNEWWDAQRHRMVTSVFDDSTKLVGGEGVGASPHNLLSDTLGDEMKLATGGKSRVFTVSLKDRSAVLPGGYSADGAFWIEPRSGDWVTSTYYMSQLPSWVAQRNAAHSADKYWNQEWKDESGQVLARTTRPAGGQASFYGVIGATPFANDYELEFARELITQEKLGESGATDLLVISLSANDILGHAVGPDDPKMVAMTQAMDRQLAEFFSFLAQRYGLANVWLGLSADHGVSPAPVYAKKFRFPAEIWNQAKFQSDLNAALAKAAGHSGNFIAGRDGDHVFLAPEAFGNMKEADAERLVGQTLLQLGIVRYMTKSQLAAGEVPNDASGRQWLHSYSNYGGWYVVAVPPPFTFPWGNATGTTHGSPYFYDTHVPLALYGVPFQPGVYRQQAQPIDMVKTFSSLLGINAPSRAAGRVLTEALSRAQGAAQ
ncbi:MAG TPA: alkaline phosphatase family protein [Terriglobales bacterium]|nr:alkaline phosphatase family protein [Terriglobales bacterium]